MKNNFLRIFAFLTALLLSLQGTTFAAERLAFSDIAGSEYEEQIDYLSENGIVNGYADDTFRPNNSINRAEFVKLIVEQLAGTPSANDYGDCFDDVSNGWFAPYVCYAKENGMVNGYADGTFLPSNTINKVEALKIVVAAYDLDLESDVQLPFNDIDENSWYIGYLKTAFSHDLIKETSGKFGPGELLSRGEMSDIVYRLFAVLKAAGKLGLGDGSVDSKISRDDSGDVAGTRSKLTNNNFEYLGSFRLPKEENGSVFAYGGWSMAFNPSGDPNGPDDGFPGSLYIVGHDYNQTVAEIAIPVPKDQKKLGQAALNVAKFLEPFTDISEGMAKQVDKGEGYKLSGMTVLPAMGSQVGEKLYWVARPYYNVGDASNDYTHGMSNNDFSNLDAKGLWKMGDFNSNMTSGYLFSAPKYFADQYLDGKMLISGLYTAQGVALTSLGPAFFAFAPWEDASNGIAPANGKKLDVIPLVYYPYTYNLETNFPDFQEPDEWGAANFIYTDSAHAIIVVGRRAMGETRYGEAESGDCNIYKGYHGEPYEPRFLFYNPDDLGKVTQGKMEADEVVPYLEWNPEQYIDETCASLLYGIEYDAKSKLLYVMQLEADSAVENPMDEPIPVLYVFRVK